jgi:hypothetical protein
MSRKVDHLYIQVTVLDLVNHSILSAESRRPMAFLFTYEGFVTYFAVNIGIFVLVLRCFLFLLSLEHNDHIPSFTSCFARVESRCEFPTVFAESIHHLFELPLIELAA